MIQLQILRDKNGKNLKVVLQRTGTLMEPIWGPLFRPKQEIVDKLVEITKSKNKAVSEMTNPVLQSYSNLMLTELKDEDIEVGNFIFGKGKETSQIISR